MTEHPLARLRAAVGLSHAAYAQLVADTHADLGFGEIVARREKVSRWESGRTVPSPTAQIAIARIHGVPEADVLRLGWPGWLTVATAADGTREAPWSPQYAVDAARDAAAAHGTSARPLTLAVTGRSLLTQVKRALTGLEQPQPVAARPGRPPTPESLDWIETRLSALEQQEAGSSATPSTLFYAARAEHRLITGLLTGAGYDPRSGARMLYLAARTARLCACLSTCLGDYATAERYSLAALRAATAVGARHQSTICLADLAGLHAAAGAPADSLAVLGGARTAVPRPSPRLTALLDTWEALARARAGEVSSGARALDRAGRALSTDRTRPALADGLPTPDLDEMRLRLCTGLSWLYQDRPRAALGCLAPLTGLHVTAGPDAPPPSPFAAGVLLYAVDAQLSLGELDSAAHSVQFAAALAGGLPGALTDAYRQRLAAHRAEPLARGLLDLLSGSARESGTG
ncbi:helix-turn-helix domain-containing protein [Streptomyces sp. NPDC059070]|uniref:helix-turn-helix domain-containing protein n=1 Tax=Streptomyces sp. NPDC059070 TaxID=3346713 RepID=UPI0036B3BF15